MSYNFLTLDEVVEIHQDQIARYGGEPGIRDSNLLESAMAMPEATFGGVFLHKDVFEMAAAYLFHLVQNHPFIDGNKRVGTMAAYTFLGLNNLELTASSDQLVEFVLSVAKGESSKADATRFFRKFTQQRA